MSIYKCPCCGAPLAYAFSESGCVKGALLVQLGKKEYYYGDLNVLTLDVGQGESVLLYSEDSAVLVDCGSSNSYVDAGSIAADQIATMGFNRLHAIVVTTFVSTICCWPTDRSDMTALTGMLTPMRSMTS